MKILIIGSEGFIGRNCMVYFRAAGHEVLGCDVVGKNEGGFYLVEQEVSDFDRIFKEVQPDVCINASGSGDVGFSFRYPDKDYTMNVRNVEKILFSIREYAPACKLLTFSSAAVYGNPIALPVKENAETNPLSPYGQHKLECEKLISIYSVKYNLRACSLRVFSVYGPGLRKQLFWDIFQKAKKNSSVVLYGTGKESRDFIFIDDLLRAINSVISNANFKGEVINVASGEETIINYAAALFLSLLGESYKLNFSGDEKSGDPKNWKADITALRELGFVPFINFDTGIKHYAEWVKELKLE